MQSPLKILFAIDSLTGGGAERIITQLANGIDRRKFEVQIVLTQGTECLQQPEKHVKLVMLPEMLQEKRKSTFIKNLEGAIFHRSAQALAKLEKSNNDSGKSFWPPLEGELRSFRDQAAGLGHYIKAWKPDCILSFLPNTNLICLLARTRYRFKAPIICSDRNHLSSELERLPWSGSRRFFIKRLYPKATRHLAVTEEVGRDLVRNFGINVNRVVTIPNGVDVDRIRKLADMEFGASTMPPRTGAIRIACVGRLSRQKGQSLLLQALARMQARNWELILLGTGEDEAALRELSIQLGISGQITFAGWQENPYAWIARCDLFVLSSLWEGMPNAMLEAMALGLPVISTNCPSGPMDILDGGRYGRLVPPNSAEALSAAIEELVKNEPMRLELGRLAKERSSDFDMKTMIRRYEQLFFEVAKR